MTPHGVSEHCQHLLGNGWCITAQTITWNKDELLPSKINYKFQWNFDRNLTDLFNKYKCRLQNIGYPIRGPVC